MLINTSESVAKLRPVADHELRPEPLGEPRAERREHEHEPGPRQQPVPAFERREPMMLCRYCVSRNVAPNIAKKISMRPKLAAENRGFSNTGG